MANNYGQPSLFKSTFGLLLIATLMLTAFYVANYLIKYRHNTSVGAATGKAEIFYQPSAATITSNSDIQIWLNVDKPLGFAHLEYSFDPKQIALSREITLDNLSLSEVIQKTSLAEANTTGKIVLALAITPTTLNSAPTGNFKLATLSFNAKVTTPNLKTTLTPNASQIQFVDLGATPFSNTTTPLTLTLNPSATPSVVKLSPTPTPTPNASPNASGPTINIKSPKDGSNFPSSGLYIGSTASDADGISLIEYYFDNQKIKTCSNQTKCDFTYKPSSIDPGSHFVTIFAYDKANPSNSTVKTITVKK